MKYMGSKARIAKYILPIILKDRQPNQWYVEPFVGGANMIDKVDGNRIGGDINKAVIEALTLIRDNPLSIPDLITEDDYKKLRNKECQLSYFVSFAMSFGGKQWGGYRRDVAGTEGCIENMKTQTRRAKQAAIAQSDSINGVLLINESFDNLPIPKNSIIYCDIPYKNTTKYNTIFDYDYFYEWCRQKHAEGHMVFISEYNMPEDFNCIWEMPLSNTLGKSGGNKNSIEKLFTL